MPLTVPDVPRSPGRRAFASRALGFAAALAVTPSLSGRATAQKPGGLAIRVTGPLSRYIAGSQTADLPDHVRELARLHILDTLAAIVACRDLTPATVARTYARAQSGGGGRHAATILGTREKASLTDAAFASAMTAHAAEINDFIPSAFVQPGPAVVSVALALAETRGRSGEQVLRSVVAGYELAGRMPKALGNENLRRAGVANHGVGPVFGAAATAASLIDLPESRIGDLLSCCTEQASGSWQWLLDVEHIEKAFVFAGMGARNGLEAALLVEAGFTGVRDSLDNPDGWMMSEAYRAGDADRRYLIDSLGSRFELQQTGFKRYPVGGPTQPAVDGLLSLLPEIDRSSVKSITIAMPGRWQAFRDAAMPALNLRYLSSIIIRDGRLDFVSAQSLERMRTDEAVRAFMQRVDIRHDPAQESAPGEARAESARVTVVDARGKHERFVPYVRGYPSHPMSRADVEGKAMDLMGPRLGVGRARAVVEATAKLETLTSAKRLVGLIAT
ncbi:MAG: 2-methylcitrate dehydratase [Alphaproteobacteria bacterium]|nr:2-methylcitrate dehydratase [Alphaproteobacteria bacterium]